MSVAQWLDDPTGTDDDPEFVFRGATRRYDARKYVELDADEIERRCRATADRILTRMTAAESENRDLTPEETQQCQNDQAAVAAFEKALEMKAEKARADERAQAIRRELASMRGQVAVSGAALGDHFRFARERALRGEGYRFTLGDCAEVLELHLRSTTTANAGAETRVAAGSSAFGIWLPREAQANNLRLPPGARIEGGVWPANQAVSATSEAATKPTLDPTGLGSDVVRPFAVSSNVSIQSELSGRGIEQFVWAGTRKVRRSVNDAFVAGMIASAGTARTFTTDAATSVDSAIAQMMGDAATTPTLIVCGADIFPALAQAGGDDATDAFPAFRGIRLVASSASSLAGHALVVDGSAVSYSMSEVEVRSQPQVVSNSTDVVIEVWFAVIAHGASGVILQDASGT